MTLEDCSAAAGTSLRVVVSGAPGAGKTTVLDRLAARGYCVVPESAREIIAERQSRGLRPRPAPAAFAAAIVERDIEKYRSSEPPAFFDRSVIDGLGMMRQAAGLGDAALATHLKRYPYHPEMFLFVAWPEIYTTDTQRDQTYEDAVRVGESVRAWYAMCGFVIREVPRASPDERADFIEAALGLA